MAPDLGLSNTTYGLGSGVFFIGYAVFQIPSNWALVKLGPASWLSAITALWGVVAASFALVRSEASFLALRFLLGLAESGAIPGMWYYTSLFYPTSRITLPYAVIETGITVSQIFGAPLAAGLLACDGLLGLRGWQWVFLAEGLPSLAMAAYIKLRLPDGLHAARFLHPAERAALSQALHGVEPPEGELAPLDPTPSPDTSSPSCTPDPATSAAPPTSFLNNLRAAAANWVVWYAGAWRILHDMPGYGVLFFTPFIIADLLAPALPAGVGTAAPPQALAPALASAPPPPSPASLAGVVLLTAVPFTAASAFHVANARHSQLSGERRLHIVLPWALGGAALLALPAAARVGPLLALLLLTIAHVGVNGANGCQTAWVASLLPAPHRALGLAMFNTVGNVGGFLGPLIVGRLADSPGGYPAAMRVMGILLIAAAAVVAVFPDGRAPGAAPVVRSVDRRTRASAETGIGLQYRSLQTEEA